MIGVIADDLTGAAEVGAVGSLHGLAAAVTLGCQTEVGPDLDLICVDTDSRSCVAPEAASRAAIAAAALRSLGTQWIYKKVDSVLRGPVLAEIEGTQHALALPRALLVPANPGLGRVIMDGRYFIRGAPINETHFRLDPEYPRDSALVRDLLGDFAGKKTRLCRLDEPLPEIGIIIAEVGNPADLHSWAARCADGILAVGGAEFFAAVLDAKARQRPKAPEAWSSNPSSEPTGRVGGNDVRHNPPAAVRELFVCGSASPVTRDFVRQMQEAGIPVMLLQLDENGRGFAPEMVQTMAEQAAGRWRKNRRLVIALNQTVGPGALALDALADLACRLLADRQDTQVYAEGGATAVRLARRLGWNRLRVLRQLSPGVVVLEPWRSPGCKFVVKPGSYPWTTATQTGASLEHAAPESNATSTPVLDPNQRPG